ncbi:MAG TPA: carboxypeptidase-like regulatory domain-containing protein, partial [Pyrinomonadaceae bacterium]|nr:carboxypeptidase-like regulatory domain-containing protein [Pyrinomonadaceae bacterium]
MNPPHLFSHCCKFLFLSSILLASFTVVARAQDLDDVTITGRVSDETGAVIPGATVTAVLQATNEERAARTDAEGRYRIIELEPGTYTVRAASAGFAIEEKRDLVTVAGQNVQLSFRLKPAVLTAEQVVVSEADAPAVDTTRTVVGGTIMAEEIESLPNVSRSPLDLVFTLGGVTEEPLSTRDLAEDRNTSANST